VNRELALIAGLGFVTGLRSMTGLAGIARALAVPRSARRGTGARASGATADRASKAAALLALGEMIADKLPGMPARTEPVPLLGRVAVGAYIGATLARNSGAVGGIVGAATALLGSYCGKEMRERLSGRDRPTDVALGFLEDAIAVGATTLLARALRSGRRRSRA
jgi:uncharacterized membrane protein